MSVDRRKLLDHCGGFERGMRFALTDLRDDPETLEKFFEHLINSIAELQANRLDAAWKAEG